MLGRSSSVRLRRRSVLLGAAVAATTAIGSAFLPSARVFGRAAVNATWSGGTTGIWSTGTNWNPNGAPNNGANTYSVFVDGGAVQNSAVTLDISATVNTISVTAGDSLSVNAGLTLSLAGTGAGVITNNGTFTVSGGASGTDMRLAGGDATVSGTGTLALGAGNARFFGNAGAWRLTNQSTIAGVGQIGINQLMLTNSGTIVANTNGTSLNVDLSDGAGNVNSGTMTAVNGATLFLFNGSIDNTSGRIIAQNGSLVDLSAFGSDGGTFSSSGTGFVRIYNSANVRNFNNLGRVDVPTGNTGFISGSANNIGSITISATASGADLRLGADTTLSGGGQVVLDNSGASPRLFGNAGSFRLTNSNNTISGGGQLGINQLLLTNAGTINSTTGLTIDLTDGAGNTNSGTLMATGSTLTILNCSIANTGRVIANGNNATVDFSASGMSGGTVSTSGTGVVRIFNSSNLSNFNNVGRIDVPTGNTGYLTGAVNNIGSVTVSATSAGTDLRINTDTTFSGGGQVILNSSGANARFFADAGTMRLTNADHTINGFGQLGINQLKLTNTGTIVANVNGTTLSVDLTDGAGNANSGTMLATNGAALQILNSTVDNTNGTMKADANSTVQLSAANVSGGSFSGAGLIQMVNSAQIGPITNAAHVSVANAHTGFLATSLNNLGSLTIDATVSGTDLRLNGDVTLTGGGQVILNSTGATARFFGNSGAMRLTNSNNTISGNGQVGSNQMLFTNTGTVVANVNGSTLSVDLTDGTLGLNSGTMLATNGATLQILNSAVDNTNGLIKADANSTVQLSAANVSGGSFASGAGTVQMVNSAQVGPITNAGRISVAGGHTGFIVSTINNTGSISLDAQTAGTDVRLPGDATFTGGGQVILNSGTASTARLFGNSGNVVLNNLNHTISGGGQIGINQTLVHNSGTINASDAARVLALDPTDSGTDGVINTGTLLASGAAGMFWNPGLFNCNGGTIVVLAGSSLTNTANLQGGVVLLDGTFNQNSNVGSSTGTIDGAGTMNVSNSSAITATHLRVGTLTVGNSGTMSIATNGGNSGTSRLKLLSTTVSNSRFDLNDNDLLIDGTGGMTYAQVASLIASARNGGAWNGSGLTSSAARLDANHATGLGLLTGSEYQTLRGTNVFDGLTVAAADKVVKYTWNGDANFDGRVTFDDYVRIDTGFNTHLTGWANGDFNYNGSVNFDDYVLIDVAFNQQTGTLSRAIDWISGDDRSAAGLDGDAIRTMLVHLDQFGAAYGAAFLAAVPEPCGALGMIGVGFAALSTRVRSRRRGRRD